VQTIDLSNYSCGMTVYAFDGFTNNGGRYIALCFVEQCSVAVGICGWQCIVDFCAL